MKTPPSFNWHHAAEQPATEAHTRLDCRCAVRTRHPGIREVTLAWLNDWSPFGRPDDGNPLASLTAKSGWHLIETDTFGKETVMRTLAELREIDSAWNGAELLAWHPLPKFSARKLKEGAVA